MGPDIALAPWYRMRPPRLLVPSFAVAVHGPGRHSQLRSPTPETPPAMCDTNRDICSNKLQLTQLRMNFLNMPLGLPRDVVKTFQVGDGNGGTGISRRCKRCPCGSMRSDRFSGCSSCCTWCNRGASTARTGACDWTWSAPLGGPWIQGENHESRITGKGKNLVSLPLFKPRCEITSANVSETVDCKVASQLKDTERKDLLHCFFPPLGSGFPSHFVWTCFCLVSEQHEQLKNIFVFCRVADVVMLVTVVTVVTVVVTMVVVVTTRFTSLVPLVAELVITSVVVEVVTVRLRPLLVISSVVTVVPSLVAVMERVTVEVVLFILVTLLVVTVIIFIITVVVMVVMVVLVVVTVLLMVVAVPVAVALATEVVMVVVLVAVAVVTVVFEVVKVVKTVELVVKVEDSSEFAAASSFLNRASRHPPSPHQIDIKPFIRFKSCLIDLDLIIWKFIGINSKSSHLGRADCRGGQHSFCDTSCRSDRGAASAGCQRSDAAASGGECYSGSRVLSSGS